LMWCERACLCWSCIHREDDEARCAFRDRFAPQLFVIYVKPKVRL
jgi:hypothetical protein